MYKRILLLKVYNYPSINNIALYNSIIAVCGLYCGTYSLYIVGT